jgi:hypothetical protein
MLLLGNQLIFGSNLTRIVPLCPYGRGGTAAFNGGNRYRRLPRIGFQSPRTAVDVRSVIVLAFAIVSPATESAPDKDLRRTDTATCDLD